MRGEWKVRQLPTGTGRDAARWLSHAVHTSCSQCRGCSPASLAPWAGSAPAQGFFFQYPHRPVPQLQGMVSKHPRGGPAVLPGQGHRTDTASPGRARHEFIPDTRRANTLQALPSAVALRSGATCPLRPCFLSTGEPSWGAAGCAPPPSTRTKQGTWTDRGAPGLHHEPVPCRSELGPDSTATHLCSKLGGPTGQISPSLRS